MMGDPEAYTDLTFVPLSTLPFELRPTTSIYLDSEGDVVQPTSDYNIENNLADAYSSGVPMQRACSQTDIPEYHRMTKQSNVNI